MTEFIQSERLELRPMTPDFLIASLSGDRLAAAGRLGVSVPDNWPDIPEILSMRLQQLREDPMLQPWLLRAMCHREERAMIGHIGCHTAPGADYLKEWMPGAIELGFTVFAPHRRQGYAEEAARALMGWATETQGIRKFVLTIAPNNFPSQSLAAKLGFERIGSHVDEVDGPEDVLGLDYDR
jgi:RimJ/RimL family protein N-acetyltransferase